MTEYIEREAAIAVIYGQHVGGKEACENARPNTYGADLREIVADIEDIPAADVAPVRHGRWIETTQPMGWDDVTCAECSECGEDFVLDEWGMEDMENLMHYCPNCGALMDKGETK